MVSITSATIFDHIEEHPNFFFGHSKDNKIRDQDSSDHQPSYKEDHPVGMSFTETADVTKLMEGDQEHQKRTFQDNQGFEGQQHRRFEVEDQHGPPQASVHDTAGPAPPQSLTQNIASAAKNMMPREPEINDMDEHSPKGRRGSDFDRLYRNSNLVHGVAGVFTE